MALSLTERRGPRRIASCATMKLFGKLELVKFSNSPLHAVPLAPSARIASPSALTISSLPQVVLVALSLTEKPAADCEGGAATAYGVMRDESGMVAEKGGEGMKYIHLCVFLSIYLSISLSISIYLSIYIYIYIYIYVYMYIYIYMYVIYIYIYIYIYVYIYMYTAYDVMRGETGMVTEKGGEGAWCPPPMPPPPALPPAPPLPPLPPGRGRGRQGERGGGGLRGSRSFMWGVACSSVGAHVHLELVGFVVVVRLLYWFAE